MDVIDAGLTTALERASREGGWSAVQIIAGELRARETARALSGGGSQVHVIDAVLAAALEPACRDGGWATVESIVGELAARRTARAEASDDGHVLDLARERAKRGL